MLSAAAQRGSQIINKQSQKSDGTKKGLYKTMNRLRLRSEAGFTLIELLVVIAIIGILAAIAIPQFAAYRKRGYEATLKADLRNAATAEEAYFAQKQFYLPGALVSGTPAGYNKSNDISGINATATLGTGTFLLTATHANCTGITWTYASASGVATGPACP